MLTGFFNCCTMSRNTLLFYKEVESGQIAVAR